MFKLDKNIDSLTCYVYEFFLDKITVQQNKGYGHENLVFLQEKYMFEIIILIHTFLFNNCFFFFLSFHFRLLL